MAKTFMEDVQQALGIPPLQQVDPNTQDVDHTAAGTGAATLLQQAVVGAVLTAMYKLSRSNEGAETILRGNASTSWVGRLFPTQTDVLVSRITAYAVASPKSVEDEVGFVATKLADMARAKAAQPVVPETISNYFKSNRNEIFHILPAPLQLGSLLDDDTIDDRTHKMDGPVSGMMHAIEKVFSGTKNEQTD